MTKSIRNPFVLSCACIGFLLSATLGAEQALDVEYAEQMPLATHSVLLDITRSDNFFVAVGERGHVVLSADGENWTQAEHVPTRSTLTTVFSLGNRLWAGGHDTVILTSGDGGRTWTKSSELPQGFLGPVKNSPLQLPGGDLFCGGGVRPGRDGVAVDLLSLGDNTWRSLGTIPAGDIVGAKNPTFLTYLRDNPSRDRFQVLCQSAQSVIVESWTRDSVTLADSRRLTTCLTPATYPLSRSEAYRTDSQRKCCAASACWRANESRSRCCSLTSKAQPIGLKEWIRSRR